jgi:two-component system, chemotaxis family, CheB/CheR fusion protein
MRVEKQYERAILNLLDAVYVCDAAGYIKIFNKAAVEIWGREPEAGKDMYCGSFKVLDKTGRLLPLDEYPMAVALKENKGIEEMEIIIQRPDGSTRHVLHSAVLIYDLHGQLDGAVNMLMDVTGDKKRKRSVL